MLKKNLNKLVLLLVLITLPIGIWGCTKQETEEESISYICDAGNFMKALQLGESTLYVGDICFDSQTEINLNYPMEIIGKPEKSKIENAHFKIEGTNVPAETTNITFKNLLLNGNVNKDDIQFEDGKTFDEIVGEMPQWHAIDGSTGYITLNIDNCEIVNYLCEDGPAIYINNDVNYREGKKFLNLTNTKIHNNIANAGTVKVFSDVLETNIDGCDFYANTARAGQGIAVGNGHSSITNTLIHDNDFFRFVYYMERKLPKIFHDDRQTFKGVTTNALGACCGALFIGGSHATVDGCKVYNNKTIFGGGIGIINAATLESDEKVEVKNTEITNNTALLCGGGIYLESNQGETTYFTNCNIIGNSAEKGSVIYTTTYSPDSDKNYGGNVQFSFCTMSDNNASDADTFSFYDLRTPELAGNIALKGCFVLDNSPYASDEDEYNYVATKEEALSSGVVTEDDFTQAIKNSVGDIDVPAQIYKKWSADFAEATEARQIGYIGQTEVPADTDEFPYWTLVFPILAIVGVSTFLILYSRKKKQQQARAVLEQEYASNTADFAQINSADNSALLEVQQDVDYSECSFAEIAGEVKKLYGGILTKREITISTYLLYGKTRKEIAQELFVSEDTIKTHLSHIFKKIGVSSKVDLKKIIDARIFSERNKQ